MPIENFFSTPIYFSNIADPIVHDEIDRFLRVTKNSDFVSPWLDNVNTTFGNNRMILECAPTLKKHVYQECINFLSELKLSYNIKIIESWVNITNYLQFQHFHIHDACHISGVFYHETSGDDGNIVFHHPSLANRTNIITKNISQPIAYKPEKGKIILFPSFLEHAVDYNKTQKARISVAFNIILY
jgi:uncharacterized protein (TIGR02466 family)